MDSRVLWRADITVHEGKEDWARGMATRYISTIQRVPKGVVVGVHVCWAGGRKVFASLGRL
jgi:hypothetical protein